MSEIFQILVLIFVSFNYVYSQEAPQNTKNVNPVGNQAPNNQPGPGPQPNNPQPGPGPQPINPPVNQPAGEGIITQAPVNSETTVSTKKPKPNNRLSSALVPSRTTRSHASTETTTTIFSDFHPALKYSEKNKPYDIPIECSDFKISSLPTHCCNLPKPITPDDVKDKCNVTCKDLPNSHCCMTECKFRETKVFTNGEYSNQAVLSAFERSLIGDFEKLKMQWSKVLRDSLAYCEKDQFTKDTTTTTVPTTTDRLEALINNAIAQGQGQIITDMPIAQTPPPVIMPPETTIAMRIRHLSNTYCNVPVQVYKIVACMRARNFMGCVNFNSTKECEDKRKMMNKCGNMLNYNY